jgi:hypothetical protein
VAPKVGIVAVDEAIPVARVEAKHNFDGPWGERSQNPRQKKTTVQEGDGGGGE